MNGLCLATFWHDALSHEEIFGTMSIAWILVMVASVFWMMALVDAINREPTGNGQFLWTMVILALPVVGALIYWFVRRPMQPHARLRASRMH
jgi:hypothetical protein